MLEKYILSKLAERLEAVTDHRVRLKYGLALKEIDPNRYYHLLEREIDFVIYEFTEYL